jgi:hypothetical protein
MGLGFDYEDLSLGVELCTGVDSKEMSWGGGHWIV